MTLARQDLLDADNAQRVGCTGAAVQLFAFALTPTGVVCVYADGILEPCPHLTSAHVAAAVLRAQARVAEVVAASETVKRLGGGDGDVSVAIRMQKIREFTAAAEQGMTEWAPALSWRAAR